MQPVEVPEARLSQEHYDEHEAAKERLRRNPSLCTSHTVIVVDQSASMRKCDVLDFRNRAQAVFGTLALDFVAKQRYDISHLKVENGKRLRTEMRCNKPYSEQLIHAPRSR